MTPTTISFNEKILERFKGSWDRGDYKDFGEVEVWTPGKDPLILARNAWLVYVMRNRENLEHTFNFEDFLRIEVEGENPEFF